MRWLVTGDTHGVMSRFYDKGYDENTSIIILGDAGVNYFLDEKDSFIKNKLENIGCFFYLVRGNHEERPQKLPNMISLHDSEVHGEVYCDMNYPHIRYFKDGGVYDIDGHSTLVIGGAYSVDKWYRLATGKTWFEDEQLTEAEMNSIYSDVEGKSFDLVLTHTCPYNVMPTDLFLDVVDQSTVDNSMELWLEKVQLNIDWKVWLFGHYHSDRIERAGIEMFYYNIESLDDVFNRYDKYKDLSIFRFPKINAET